MTKIMRTGIYPGTFDPITFGHMDVIKRGLHVVDKLIVGIAADNEKDCIFTMKDRLAMVEEEVAVLGDALASRVVVMPFTGLLVKFAKEQDARLIIRGMRVVSDFEYEFQMASMNARLDPDIETIFLTASENTQFISSRFVKQICRLGGDISQLASDRVAKRLKAYYDAIADAAP